MKGRRSFQNFWNERLPFVVATSMPTPLKVDIWSDIACPWCYIGKRKFEAGLAEFAGNSDVVVEYHSYELSPDVPSDFEGNTVDFLADRKGLGRSQVHDMLKNVTDIASQVGLAYDFDSTIVTKTLLAHELLHFAKEHGKQSALKDRLLSAHFERGEHVGDLETLVRIASEVGLDSAAARAALENHTYAPDVQNDINQAQQLGINGVPFFVFDNKYGVSGAQSSETFTQILEQVAEERVANEQ